MQGHVTSPSGSPQQSRFGFALFDAELRLVAWNRLFESVHGYPPDLLAPGASLETLVGAAVEPGARLAADMSALLHERMGGAASESASSREHELGDGRILRIASEPTPSGGILYTCEDITQGRDEQRRSEHGLRQSEERYALATRTAEAWIYEWNAETGTIYLSERPAPFYFTPVEWVARIHPADMPAYHQAMVDHFKGLTPQVEREYRVRDVNGETRWVLERAIGVRDRNGRVTKVIGALSDVTRRKHAEIELRRAHEEAEQALAGQTALRGVLEALSRSAFDLDAVLHTLIESTTRLSNAEKGFIFRREGDVFRFAVDFGASEAFRDYIERHPVAVDAGTLVGRTALHGRTVHIEDALTDPQFTAKEAQRLGRFRTMLGVPIIRDGTVIGGIALWKERVEPFTDAQIALVTSFSSQALIAIENARLFSETKEALEQQTATAEILKITSASPTNAQPVFGAILANAVRLCQASVGAVFMFDGEVLANVAYQNASAEFAEFLRTSRPRPSRETTTRRCALERRTVHTADLLNDPEYAPLEFQRRENVRTVLSVPMICDDRLVGVITLWRREVKPFTDKQIALVQTFADQAVIAIENVRLFNETKEALDFQKATSEILASISGSITEAKPVFDRIARNVLRLFGTRFASVQLLRDAQIELIASHGEPGFERIAGHYPRPLDAGTIGGSVILSGNVVQFTPVIGHPDIPASTERMAHEFGFDSVIGAPMIREHKVVGAIVTAHRSAIAFTDKQVALLRTFADQAVIAIENVRLFNETREALERQKALAEVLGTMSGSIADTEPVFDKILDSCQRLFEGHLVGLTLAGDDGQVRLGAYKGENREQMEQVYPYPLDRNSGTGQAMLDRKIVHFADVGAPGSQAPRHVLRGAQAAGFKSIIFAPLIAEEGAIGALWVGRRLPGPFSAEQTALLKTFADQAVIGIQNTRLFREAQEKRRQLEVANRHKSEFLANVSHELRTPLNAIIGFTRIVMRRSKEQLEPKQYENLEKILMSGQNLLALINAILDLSKVEAGRIEVKPGEIELAPVLEQCVRTIEPLIRDDGVMLIKEFDTTLPRMVVDEEKLRQIVINLLSNAAKFTSRGSIRVRALAANGSVDIAVADTGIGIAAEKLGLIFEAFEQGHAGDTRDYGGTGLGLTIARRLARLMGGDIRVESAQGSGSIFTLTLPTRYQALQA